MHAYGWSRPTKEAMTSNRRLWTIFLSGLLLLAAGWATAHAGVVPILGVLVAALSPDIFLMGLVAVSVCIAWVLTSNNVLRAVFAIVLSILFGLNTRLPSLLVEIWKGPAERTTVISRLGGAVGQPIHVAADVPALSARRNPFAHARPACVGDNCLATEGFRTPIVGIEGDYWHEKVVDSVLTAGFGEARQGEIAPTLTTRQTHDGYWSQVQIVLVDAKGTVVARYEGRYRNGWPFETSDIVDYEHRTVPSAIEYLLHGNWFNRLAVFVVPRATPYPVSAFLKASTTLAHPQGTELGLRSGRQEPNNGLPSAKVTLEVLAQKTYDPVWIIKEDRNASVSKWSAIAWDKTRGDRCRDLLTPEIVGAPQLQTWHLFVNDATRRKKVRYTGFAICDPDAIWFQDYVAERGRMVLTKFTAKGDFQYRISFEKPPEPYGFAGGIMLPTFNARDGYLYFEWWNTDQSGWDRHVARSMQVRIKEPQVPTAANSAASATDRK